MESTPPAQLHMLFASHIPSLMRQWVARLDARRAKTTIREQTDLVGRIQSTFRQWPLATRLQLLTDMLTSNTMAVPAKIARLILKYADVSKTDTANGSVWEYCVDGRCYRFQQCTWRVVDGDQ
jgi:hypothetical protein